MTEMESLDIAQRCSEMTSADILQNVEHVRNWIFPLISKPKCLIYTVGDGI